MHSARSSLLILSLIASTACRLDEPPSAPAAPSAASQDLGSEGIGIFHRYVAIGTSISMGVQSDGVYEVGQRTAWPVQLAAMAHRTLTIPLIQSALTAQLRRMSARIRSIAVENGYAYFDLDALYSRREVRTPFSVTTLMFSPTPFGQYISLDGFHPSADGQTVLAQAAARALNATYGLGIPLEMDGHR